jgi:hypothetical protein
MYSSKFWKDAAERAIRSVAQGALLVLVNRLVIPNAFYQLEMASVVDTVLLAVYAGLSLGIISLLTSVATGKVGPDKDSPSVVQDLEHQGLL